MYMAYRFVFVLKYMGHFIILKHNTSGVYLGSFNISKYLNLLIILQLWFTVHMLLLLEK